MFASIWRIVAMACAVLAVAAIVGMLWFRGTAASDRARADAADARADVLAAQVIRAEEIIREERKREADMAVIAAQYEQDKADAQDKFERDIADLRAGNLRLRDEWAGCATDAVSATAAAARHADDSAQLRRESAARIIAAGDRADAQVRGLQRVIEADRQGVVR